jgi:hypothetical protein
MALMDVVDWNLIRERVTENGSIRAAAVSAAEQMRRAEYGGVATVSLTPGDMTHYKFVVVGPDRNMGFGGGDYLVVLATGFGRTYAWSAHPMHPDYCADKWTTDGNPWTGVVVAEFLSVLSTELTP